MPLSHGVWLGNREQVQVAFGRGREARGTERSLPARELNVEFKAPDATVIMCTPSGRAIPTLHLVFDLGELLAGSLWPVQQENL